MIDLHTHSTASDGTFSPGDLVNKAVSQKLKVLAITDHDTVAGLEEAKKASQNQDIIFIPGIELNIQWSTGEFHLLGLGLKQVSDDLNSIITYLQRQRETRNQKIVELLNKDGFEMTMAELIDRFETESIGRPHIAQMMVEKGYVKQRQQAFDNFLGKGRKYYVDRAGADLSMASKAIKNSGGVPVHAHPLSLYLSINTLETTMEEIKAKGVMGLEAYHPAIRVSQGQQLEKIARKLDMFVTAGSDYHGKVRADRHLGKTAGNEKINDRFYFEELAKYLQ